MPKFKDKHIYVSINFGALMPPIRTQLKEQGIKHDLLFKKCREDILQFQKDADALVRLNLRGLLSDSSVRIARRRLIKKIVATLEEKARKGS